MFSIAQLKSYPDYKISAIEWLVHCGESPYIPSMSFARSLSPRKRGAGIQGIETDPGFRVFARNDNAANSRKEKNMYAILPYGTRRPVGPSGGAPSSNHSSDNQRSNVCGQQSGILRGFHRLDYTGGFRQLTKRFNFSLQM